MNTQQKEQKELLKLQKAGYTYLARDKDNDLYAYKTKPSKLLDVWAEKKDNILGSVEVNKKLFNSIKFYNSEATLIEDLINKEPENIISYLTKLNYKYNYLVCDENGTIRAFKNKPKKYLDKGIWSDKNLLTIELNVNEFKKDLSEKIKWSNTRPTLISDLLYQFNTLDDDLKMIIFSKIDQICTTGIYYKKELDSKKYTHINGENILFDNNNLYIKNDTLDIKLPFKAFEVLWFLTEKDIEKSISC